MIRRTNFVPTLFRLRIENLNVVDNVFVFVLNIKNIQLELNSNFYQYHPNIF